MGDEIAENLQFPPDVGTPPPPPQCTICVLSVVPLDRRVAM
jgi:hypothetical protein